MRVNGRLVTCALAATIVTGACGSSGNRITTPSSGNPGEAAASSPPTTRPSPGSPPPWAEGGSCNAANAQSATGKPASAALLEWARLAAQASTARFIRPNEPITTEFLGSRLNLQLNAQDVVHAVSCG